MKNVWYSYYVFDYTAGPVGDVVGQGTLRSVTRRTVGDAFRRQGSIKYGSGRVVITTEDSITWELKERFTERVLAKLMLSVVPADKGKYKKLKNVAEKLS